MNHSFPRLIAAGIASVLVFAACGGSRGDSGHAVTAPPNDSRDTVVAVRKQKSRGGAGSKQLQSGGAVEGGAASVVEMDV